MWLSEAFSKKRDLPKCEQRRILDYHGLKLEKTTGNCSGKVDDDLSPSYKNFLDCQLRYELVFEIL